MMKYTVKPIRNVIALLTNQCPLACPYCFEDRDTQKMSFETARATLDFIHRVENVQHGFTFFGGEPTVEWDSIIVPLIEYSKASNQPTRFNMTTNGFLLNQNRIDWLIENKIEFMYSMDGGKETQNINRPTNRNGESFDVVSQNILYILERKPNQVV